MTSRGKPRGGLYPAVYEAFVGLQDLQGMGKQRRRVTAVATGSVLEVGVGTGRNLPYYSEASQVVGIDPDRGMLKRAAERLGAAPCPVELLVGTAEDLPFPPDSFDSVVITLTLCTVPDPVAALAEVRRVLRPDGRFIFLEHVRSPSRRVARFQDLATPGWRRIAGGCRLNRSTVATVRGEGFEITQLWRSRDGKGGLVQGVAVLAGTGPPSR